MSKPSMTFGEALDHARSFHTRIVKPFALLADVLETAVLAEAALKGSQERIAQAEARLADLDALIVQGERQVIEIQEKVAGWQTKATRATEAADESIAGDTRRATEIAQSHAKRLAALDAEAEAKIRALNQAFAARQVQLEQDLEALDQRKHQVAAEIEGLLARLR